MIRIIQKESNKDFFVPFVENREQAQRIYSSVMQYVKSTHHIDVLDYKIQKITYVYDNFTYTEEVGDKSRETGEPIIAIFIDRNKCYICTNNHGVARNRPLEYEAVSCELFSLRW